MKIKQYIWPIFGVIVMLLSARLLYHEFYNPHSQLFHLSMSDLLSRLKNIGYSRWVAASICTVVAYTALAGYDRIALEHLNRKISWWFIAICSFSAYALSHSIGASIFSGAAIRYRAYSTQGLSGSEVAILVGFCSLTFALGVTILTAFILLIKPDIVYLIQPYLTHILHRSFTEPYLKTAAFAMGLILTGIIILYIAGSWLQLRPLTLGKNIKLTYPKLPIVLKQLSLSPLEILGSAGIIYFMLPSALHANFIIVLAAFLASFTIGILSNAPGGGLGVFEVIFISLVPNIDARDLLVALIVFRCLYLILPLIISLFFVAIFEIQQYRIRHKT
ncbi:lysylphosphatidylglycerol synthase domain-containing protein [Bartonella sp. TP]|uniref:lysylphosphatidylglycerol synthase domain-containing protein n=1 Tax=Bartonella sp. TP TaxID=3057550 RepID=UPI0025B0E854|nr:lysylphosphatidylglycerol synthase domain-containing protein [Bartonella sp. TP]WJW79788.1 lysylphosphatidylglycerol synthase domain-containing protein [Bartonella sp. TP]